LRSWSKALVAMRQTDSDPPLRHEIRRLAGRIIRTVIRVRSRHETQQARLTELQLVWPAHRLDQLPASRVAEGYDLRTYRPGDEVEFFGLMDRAGFKGWNPDTFHPWLMRILPDGFFFLVDTCTGTMAATAMACHNPTPLHPFGGTLSCVAADPVHQGRGLGHAVSAAATCRLLRAGYRDIYMETDDWRLAALKTYLKMGWVPFLFEEDMPNRWKAACAKLSWPYTPESWRTL